MSLALQCCVCFCLTSLHHKGITNSNEVTILLLDTDNVYLPEHLAAIDTAQKIKFSKDFFSNCDEIRSETADLVTFTEEIHNGKLHFLCSETSVMKWVHCIFRAHIGY